MQALIVLPSYNESENITTLVDRVLALGYCVCVVDDNSPDGTPETLRRYSEGLSSEVRERFHFVVRAKKDGRGGAVREGLRWGLHCPWKFDAFVEMDCDFSHPPEDLPKGLQLLERADVVMGSRYPDGSIVGWPLTRRVLSLLANLLARTLIDWKVADYTNGYRFYNRRATEFMCNQPQRHKGYIYLSETVASFLKAGFRIRSFPILFVNRQRGRSNTGPKEVLDAFFGIFSICWEYRFGKAR